MLSRLPSAARSCRLSCVTWPPAPPPSATKMGHGGRGRGAQAPPTRHPVDRFPAGGYSCCRRRTLFILLYHDAHGRDRDPQSRAEQEKATAGQTGTLTARRSVGYYVARQHADPTTTSQPPQRQTSMMNEGRRSAGDATEVGRKRSVRHPGEARDGERFGEVAVGGGGIW